VSLAQRLGVDPRSFFDLIAGGGLDMPFLQAKAGLILNNGLAPAQFAAGTAAKDARLIVEAGARHGIRLDLTAASAERLERAAARGHAAEDLAAAYYAGFDEQPPA
jgi:3-hydroxyisobutyrate dehydrogenase